MRKAPRLLAVLLAAASLAGCSTSSSESVPRHDLNADVQNSAGDPLIGLDVTVWIVDQDLPGSLRQPDVLDVATTDQTGRATWTYESFEPPYICGYRVNTLNGTELAYLAPNPAQRASGANGVVQIIVP